MATTATWTCLHVVPPGAEIDVDVLEIGLGRQSLPAADLYVIGGGQDGEQVLVNRSLERLGAELRSRVVDGAAVLAVCAGYQCLAHGYRSARHGDIQGAGLFDAWTDGTQPGRIVGPTVAQANLPALARAGRSAAARYGAAGPGRSLVGFENHAGRTRLGSGARALGLVTRGRGNNGCDGGEGLVAMPGEGGVGGLRVGTYLHGPLLPRNPHLADLLIGAALSAVHPLELEPLDDALAWRAHVSFMEAARPGGIGVRLRRAMMRLAVGA